MPAPNSATRREHIETWPTCTMPVKGADALVVCTDWDEFKSPDFRRREVKSLMKAKVIFDGRNLYRHWISQARREARTLASATESGQEAVRAEVVSRIVRARALLKLQPIDESVLSGEFSEPAR
jgi:hypothetical protein